MIPPRFVPLIEETADLAAAFSSAGKRLYLVGGVVRDTILDTITPPLGCVAVRADACERFDERFLAVEDVDWWLRMAVRHPVASEPDIGWLWRRHSGPRTTHGAAARAEGSLLLLDRHREYFDRHPRAASFRWYRIAALAAASGDRALVRRAALRSIRLRPTPRTVARSARVLRRVGR